MKNSIKYLLAGALIFSTFEEPIINPNSFFEISKLTEKRIQKEGMDSLNKKYGEYSSLIFNKNLEKYVQEINPPKYNLKKESCSGYLRRSAGKLFDKNYSWGDAWNLRYRNKVVSEINGKKDIINLIQKEELIPGMAVGLRYSRSKYRNKKDDQGKKASFTHVVLYVGLNDKYEPEFIHQENRTIKKSGLDELVGRGYIPVIVMDDMDAKKILSQQSF